jgi:uncharacterized membrane protein YgdD (TMEM256/DUF423 family)
MQIDSTHTRKIKRFTIILGTFGVVIGSFGAHLLHPVIESTGHQATWDTGMFYYWVHTLALFVLSFSSQPDAKTFRIIRIITTVWGISILLFCGSLIALSLGAPSFIGAITPLGGLGFIAGWLLLARTIPAVDAKQKP